MVNNQYSYQEPESFRTGAATNLASNLGTSLPSYSAAAHPSPRIMSQPHRGLPPPHILSLNVPSVNAHIGQSSPSGLPSAINSGQLPSAPVSWSGQEEQMRSWLHAKAEEDRRKQEEERSRQEQLRLDTKKVEHMMLQDALRAGVPAQLVPMMFAGLGGVEHMARSLDFLQQYLVSIQHQQQQMMHQQVMQTTDDPNRRTVLQPISMMPINPQPIVMSQQPQSAQGKPVGYGPPPPPPAIALPSMSPSSKQRALQPVNTAKQMYPPEPLTAPLSRSNKMGHNVNPGPPSAPSMHGHPQLQPHPASSNQNQESTQGSAQLLFCHWQPPKNQDEDDSTEAGHAHRPDDHGPGSAKHSSAFTSVNEQSVPSPASRKRKTTVSERNRFDSPDVSDRVGGSSASTPAKKRSRKASEIIAPSTHQSQAGHPLSFTRGGIATAPTTTSHTPILHQREEGGPNFPRQLLSRPLDDVHDGKAGPRIRSVSTATAEVS